MLRSSRIPPLLSRVTGDGIHTALLITSDGELLGSFCTNTNSKCSSASSSPLVKNKNVKSSGSSTDSTSSVSSSSASSSPLDKESIAALIAEVTSDYRRAGHELLLLNFDHPIHSTNANNSRRRGGRWNGTGRDDSGTSGMDTSVGAGPASSGATEQQVGDQPPPPQRDHGSILSCLLLEMEMGLIGVASAGPDCLVIAIADQNQISQKVEHGMMKARLMAVAGYIREAFSQLNAVTS